MDGRDGSSLGGVGFANVPVLAEAVHNSSAHLCRSLSGESNRKDRFWRDAFVEHVMQVTFDQYSGLAGTRSRANCYVIAFKVNCSELFVCRLQLLTSAFWNLALCARRQSDAKPHLAQWGPGVASASRDRPF